MASSRHMPPVFEGDAIVMAKNSNANDEDAVANEPLKDAMESAAAGAVPAPPSPPPQQLLHYNVTVHYSLSFKRMCVVTVACPFVALLTCFVTAYIFQYDDIHETHCRVYNIVPSISAITGVSPQRYLWRASVALHIGPRYIIAAVYRAYQQNLINNNANHALKTKANLWLDIAFWLNVIEVTALGGVTYISNLENYPVHEKLFIVFMVTSLLHMVACIKAVQIVAISNDNLEATAKELYYKKFLFTLSIVCTIGMIIFFLKHRLLCHNMAFSWFAICEYVVATANMAFHLTLVYNFPNEQVVVAKGLHQPQPLQQQQQDNVEHLLPRKELAATLDAAIQVSTTKNNAKHKADDLKLD